MATYQTNPDGLTQRYGTLATTDLRHAGDTNVGGVTGQLVVDFQGTDLGTAVTTFWTEDASGGTTVDSPSGVNASIPAYAYITRATLLVADGFVGATGTMNIGLYESDGSVIDADGIDQTIAVTAINAQGDAVVCNGALVGGDTTGNVVSIGAAAGYVGIDYDTAAFTAGSARLVIDYMLPRGTV